MAESPKDDPGEEGAVVSSDKVEAAVKAKHDFLKKHAIAEESAFAREYFASLPEKAVEEDEGSQVEEDTVDEPVESDSADSEDEDE